MIRHLAEQLGAANLWSEVGGDIRLLDQLDDDAVAIEAFRSGYGCPGAIPAAVVTTMIARAELTGSDPAQRRLTRALAALRVGSDEPPLKDSQLRWGQLTRSLPHLRLIGHTDPVTAVAFGRLPDGRVLLASGSGDDTVRLWDPATGTPVGGPAHRPHRLG